LASTLINATIACRLNHANRAMTVPNVPYTTEAFFSHLVTSGPPGVTGFAGGRPKATEIIGFWPALVGKDKIVPRVEVVRA